MSEIVQKAEDFVTKLLETKLDPKFLYHNLKHTQRVVKSTKELLEHHDMEPSKKEELVLAAWFHDTGYTQGTDQHEKRSGELAADFLKSEGFGPAIIESIQALILATERYHVPT
ncbi:MAG: HD domain-containing protein, partial [Bacteroidota bacterium]